MIVTILPHLRFILGPVVLDGGAATAPSQSYVCVKPSGKNYKDPFIGIGSPIIGPMIRTVDARNVSSLNDRNLLISPLPSVVRHRIFSELLSTS